MQFYGFLFLFWFIIAAPATGQSWTVLDEAQISDVTQVGDRLFCTGSEGESHFIGISEDEGDSWTRTSINAFINVPAVPVGIGFPDEEYGLIALRGSFTGELLATADGGASWQSIYYGDLNQGIFEGDILPDGMLFQPWSIHPFNDSTVLVNGFQQGSFLRTTNKGIDWERYTFPGGVWYPKMRLTEDGQAFLYDWERLYRSRDAGENWDTLYTATDGFQLAGYDFLDSLRGYLILHRSTSNIDQRTRLLRTADGGRTWEIIRDLTGELLTFTDIAFTDPLNAWGLFAKTVFRSTDGGYSWSAFQELPFESFRFVRTGGRLFIAGRGLARLDAGGVTSTRRIAVEAATTVYPNPVRRRLYLRNLPAAFTRYAIADLLGRPVHSGILREPRIDLRSLPPGSYLLRLGNERGFQTTRLFLKATE